MLQNTAKSSVDHFLHIFAVQFHQIRAKTSRYPINNRYNDDDNVDDYTRRKRKENNQEDRLQLYKSRGQHLLTNPRILDSIVRKSDIGPGDTVLEIGPGTGNLTMKLLEVANNVVAVEVDHRMVEVLRNRVSQHGLDDKLTV